MSRSLIVGTAKDKSTGRRIPAANLETIVITKIRSFLADEGAILDAIRHEYAEGNAQARLIARGVKITRRDGSASCQTDPRHADRDLSRPALNIRPRSRRDHYRRGFLVQLLCAAQSVELGMQGGKPSAASNDILTLTVKARLQRVGREMRMLVENSDDQTDADPGLLRIVARAHDIQARLMQDTELTVHMIARQERVSANYVYRLLRIPSLAPDIITGIINGKNPPQLTAKKLMRLTPQIPVGWAEQRKLLGFQ